MHKKIFEQKYLSQSYIEQTVAYKIVEYLPKTVDYVYWRTFEQKPGAAQNLFLNGDIKTNNPFHKELFVLKSAAYSLPIHYFPYWQIFLDHKEFIPTVFDRLGRPVINVDHPTIVSIDYNQTTVEKMGNLITVLTLIILIITLIYRPLWKHMK